jgi:hypothetical protein
MHALAGNCSVEGAGLILGKLDGTGLTLGERLIVEVVSNNALIPEFILGMFMGSSLSDIHPHGA